MNKDAAAQLLTFRSAPSGDRAPHTADDGLRICEHVLAGNTDDSPSEIGETFVLLDIALPLPWIGAMLVPLEFDRDAKQRIGKIHAAHEKSAIVEDVVVGDGLRRARIHDDEADPSLHARRDSPANERQRRPQRGRTTSSTCLQCLFEVSYGSPRVAFDASDSARNPDDSDYGVADCHEVVGMPQHPTQHCPGGRGIGDPDAEGGVRHDLGQRSADLVAVDPLHSRSAPGHADVRLRVRQHRKRKAPENRGRRVAEVLSAVHVNRELDARADDRGALLSVRMVRDLRRSR